MADTAIFAAIIPAGAAISALGAWWAAATPRAAIGGLLGTLLLGQLIRIPLPGQAGGLLVSDIAVVLVLIAAFGTLLRCGRQELRIQSEDLSIRAFASCSLMLISLFLAWSLFTLIIHMPALGSAASGVSFAYWVRLTTHLLVLPALLVLFRDVKLRRFASSMFGFTIIALALLGLLQLFVLPNIAGLPSIFRSAWDPHEGRLVATWLDPNFVGIFFVITGIYFAFRRNYMLLIPTATALVLTQSRSSLGALVLAAAVVSPFILLHVLSRSQKSAHHAMGAVAVSAIAAASIAAGALLFGSRLPAVFFDDPTVSLRATALQQTWQVLGQHTAIFGEGFNAYQFAALREGLISSFAAHSRAGSDNSLLTLWITTGAIGVVLFLLPWMYIATTAWRIAWQRQELIFLAVPMALIAVLIHAQAVNSLLYGHILITLAMAIALVMSYDTHSRHA